MSGIDIAHARERICRMALRTLLEFLNKALGGPKDTEIAADRYWRTLQRNYASMREAYLNKFENVINTDNAKELCPYYSKNRESRVKYSVALYPPAHELASRIFLERVQDRDVKSVIFLAGGAASGKSTAAEIYKPTTSARSVLYVDGTLSNYDKAEKQIRECVDRGKNVLIIYVFCPVQTAVRLALDRAIQRGRVISLETLAETHFYSQKTFLRLFDTFIGETLVHFKISDVTNLRHPKEETIAFLKEVEYPVLDDLLTRVNHAYTHEHSRRFSGNGAKIPREIDKAFLAKGRRVG